MWSGMNSIISLFSFLIDWIAAIYVYSWLKWPSSLILLNIPKYCLPIVMFGNQLTSETPVTCDPWNPQIFNPIKNYPPHNSYICHVAWSSDERYLSWIVYKPLNWIVLCAGRKIWMVKWITKICKVCKFCTINS